ncbi:ComEC/Rec2 family competence protein [Pedobacter sandarakinus]|uniref:ComEC/Rec2 family competence protein n=1 Tax=Pedobacter sandarakinus TaxID=353156 RepID=UPI0022468F8F|nr:ComEC/Rec2 family competence protein [Pedobacter sandarakinus]MCX2574265.1 ComEC/Rec2 family competence protein [Pedobacter sandarakinus]
MFKTEVVFARILAPFIFGIGFAYYFASKNLLWVAAAFVFILFFLVIVSNLWYKKLKAYRSKGILGISILICFCSLGVFLVILNNEQLKSTYFGNQNFSALKIYVNDEPQISGDIVRFKARVTAGYNHKRTTKLTGQLLVALKLDSTRNYKVAYGDEFIMVSKHLSIDPPFNPAEFDFKHWLAAQNIYRQTFINSSQIIETRRNVGNSLVKFAINSRKKQVSAFKKNIVNPEAFAVASTLILGYRADLSQETLNAYSKTGTIHALSVSGSHVAIIFFILDYLLKFMDRKRRLKIVKFILICCLIWAYALITGLSPSVVRSAIMIMIFIAGKTFARNKNSYNTLAFAAFCQLVYNPFLLWDVGFQLSYLSVFGLIYLQPKIYNWVYVKNSWLDKIWSLIALSTAAQVITFPLSIYYFHQFPMYFLLGNLFISIPLILIMVIGMLTLIPFLSWLSPTLEWIIKFTNLILKWIADLPFATVSSIYINLLQLALLSLALGIFIYALAYYKRYLLLISVVLYLAYSCLIEYGNWSAFHQRKIIFFSLRKNYAAAFMSGTRTILITDLKTTDRSYQFFIAPALAQSQIRDVKLITLAEDKQHGDFTKNGRQIIFNKYKILIIDSSLNYKIMHGRARFDAIWLTGNTKFNINGGAKDMTYSNILIDATNNDYKIAAFKKFAEINRIPFHILKKNPAYLVQFRNSQILK